MTTMRIAAPSALAGVAVGMLAGEWRNRYVRARLRLAAHTEPLTGLLNRTGIGVRVDTALARTGSAALLLLDLDGFKEVNDTRGHAAGDAVLIDVANQIRAALLPGEHAARHGGDEFSILLTVAEPAWARRRAAAMVTAVSVPDVAGVSIGYAVASDALALWETADAEMYETKRRHHAENQTPDRASTPEVA